jgi:putative transposase
VTDVLFRPLFAFFLVERASRRVVHVGVTRHPTDAWAAQPLRDNDAKYGPCFARLAEASGITVLRTPLRAPRANAIVERCHRSVRREGLDQLLLCGEAQLRRAFGEYVAYFNQDRPHQGRGQRVPLAGRSPGSARQDAGTVVAIPVLGGLHHTYRRAT